MRRLQRARSRTACARSPRIRTVPRFNGKLVLRESIADLGGLSIANRAYRGTLAGRAEPAPIEGFTADQRFYLVNAAVCGAPTSGRSSRSS